MILHPAGREFYTLSIVTDPAVADWEASFDGGVTWDAGTEADGKQRWLVAGPDADPTGAVYQVPDGVRLVPVMVRGASAPEVIVRTAPSIIVAALDYCTVGEARAAGAVGTDTNVAEAILYAQGRVESYTGDVYTPRELTVVARVGGDGRALLPHRVQSVTAVLDGDTGNAYGAGSWRVTTSATPGQVDAVGLGPAHLGFNILVVGMEPWNRWQGPASVQVTGVFGWPSVPTAVEFATATLAADWTRTHRGDEDADPSTPDVIDTVAVDPEGNVVPVVPPFESRGDTTTPEDPTVRRTTGNRRVDAMLADYRRIPTLTGV